MSHFLGQLGALREIPCPQVGRSVETARGGSERVTLGGRRVVQRSARAPRSWSLELGSWSAPEQVAFLAACASGAVPGPLFMHLGEAAQTNLLPADLAAPGAMGLTSLGPVGATVGVSLPLVGLVQSSSAAQSASVGAWSATIPVRPSVSLTLSAWASAAGAAVAWRTVNAAGAQVATGTVTAAAFAGGFRGAATFVPASTVVGVQVRLPAGSLRVGGLRLVETPAQGALLRTNAFTNPSFETAGATFEDRRNLIPDPRGVAGWGPVTANTSYETSGGPSGVPTWVKYTLTATGGGGGGSFITIAQAVGAYSPAVPGEAYTVTVSVIHSQTPANRCAPFLTFYDAGGTQLSQTIGTNAPGPNNQWYEVTYTFPPAPAGTVSARVGLSTGSISGWPTGSFVGASRWMMTDATGTAVGGGYFDGTTSPDSDYAASWSGAANASASILTGTRVAGVTGGLRSSQWAADGTRNLRVEAGQTATVSVAGPVTITARAAGQTATLAGTTVTSTAAGQALTLTGSGTLTLGPGWWDRLGDGITTWFSGATTSTPYKTYAWTGAANASTSTERVTTTESTGWLPGHGVPQVVIDDPGQTLQLVMAGRVASDYSITIREVG